MPSKNRKHDHSSFFKYLSSSTAKIVLTNCALRWSSPLLFNNPFDVPREISFGVTPKEITEAISRRVIALIESPPEDTSHLEPKLQLLIETVKKGILPDNKIELIETLRHATEKFNPTGEGMEALRDIWRSWIPDFRILCFADNPAHMAMWYHYADKYKGVVLEFRCDDKLDSAWLAAEPVIYSKEKPEVYTADGWAEILSMRQELSIQKIFNIATYSKVSDWSYESEWRIVGFKRPTDIGNFTDYKFNPLELSGIYFGPLISAPDRGSLLSLSAGYPNVRVFEVSIGMSRELLFNEILANRVAGGV